MDKSAIELFASYQTVDAHWFQRKLQHGYYPRFLVQYDN